MRRHLLKISIIALVMLSCAGRASSEDVSLTSVCGTLIRWSKAGRAGDPHGNNGVPQGEPFANAFVFLQNLDTDYVDSDGHEPMPTSKAVFIQGGVISPQTIVLLPNNQLDVVNLGPDPEIITFNRGNFAVDVDRPLRLTNIRQRGFIPHGIEFGTLKNRCEVLIHENRFVAVTDDAGAFRISDVPPGTWYVHISLRGLGMADLIRLSPSAAATFDEDGIQVIAEGGEADLQRISLYVRPSRL